MKNNGSGRGGHPPSPERGVRAKKHLGQNFIVNPGVCPKFVESCGIDERFGVLEIGPGLGALTVELAKRAKKVLAVEVDGELIPRLRENVAPFRNVEIIEGDILSADIAGLIQSRFGGLRAAAAGNLPYYITSPVIMKLLEERPPVEFVAAMVQKEAAQRLCAPEGSRESGAVTLAVRYYSEPHMLFDVSPGSFMPPPSVTSTVIKLDIRTDPPVRPRDEKAMFKVIRAAFSQRRKTAVNALSSGLGRDKAAVAAAFEALSLSPDIRPERLVLRDFAALSDLLFA